jgi:hypothetical protein
LHKEKIFLKNATFLLTNAFLFDIISMSLKQGRKKSKKSLLHSKVEKEKKK